MKDIVRSLVLTTSLSAAMPMVSYSAENSSTNFFRGTNSELLYVLSTKDDRVVSFDGFMNENINSGSDSMENMQAVDAKTMTDAILRYFDEEVTLYKLKGENRTEINNILMEYFSHHSILKMDSKGKMVFKIDDMNAFKVMINKISHKLFDSMPYLVRKIAVGIVFGGETKLQNKLDNLEQTVYGMSKKTYENVVFDYAGGIIKRVVGDKNGKMSINDYYFEVKKIFPNKNFNGVENDLKKSNQMSRNITDLKYPF